MKEYHCEYCRKVVMRAEVGTEIRKGTVHICADCFRYYCRNMKEKKQYNYNPTVQQIRDMMGMN